MGIRDNCSSSSAFRGAGGGSGLSILDKIAEAAFVISAAKRELLSLEICLMVAIYTVPERSDQQSHLLRNNNACRKLAMAETVGYDLWQDQFKYLELSFVRESVAVWCALKPIASVSQLAIASGKSRSYLYKHRGRIEAELERRHGVLLMKVDATVSNPAQS